MITGLVYFKKNTFEPTNRLYKKNTYLRAISVDSRKRASQIDAVHNMQDSTSYRTQLPAIPLHT